MAETTVRPALQTEEVFGRDHGLIQEVIVTGRKVGADRQFWSRLAHDEQVFREVVRHVLGEQADYQPTTSQQGAADIMGRNYHGPDQVAKHFGVQYRDAELGLLAEVPFSAEVLRAGRETRILVAGYPLTILEVRKRMKKNFWDQDWYHNENFARQTKVQLQWHLLRKDEVPNSRSKTYEEQTALLRPEEEAPFACEVVYAMNLHFAETGERLFNNVYVRCQDRSSGGDRVDVGRFNAAGLDVHIDWGGNRLVHLGLAAAWKCA